MRHHGAGLDPLRILDPDSLPAPPSLCSTRLTHTHTHTHTHTYFSTEMDPSHVCLVHTHTHTHTHTHVQICECAHTHTHTHPQPHTPHTHTHTHTHTYVHFNTVVNPTGSHLDLSVSLLHKDVDIFYSSLQRRHYTP